MANTSKEGDVNAMKQDKAVQSLQKYSYEPKRADQNAAPTVLSVWVLDFSPAPFPSSSH
jgi:hypothetical protein